MRSLEGKPNYSEVLPVSYSCPWRHMSKKNFPNNAAGKYENFLYEWTPHGQLQYQALLPAQRAAGITYRIETDNKILGSRLEFRGKQHSTLGHTFRYAVGTISLLSTQHRDPRQYTKLHPCFGGQIVLADAHQAVQCKTRHTREACRFAYRRIRLLASNGVLPVTPLLSLLRVLLLAEHGECMRSVHLTNLSTRKTHGRNGRRTTSNKVSATIIIPAHTCEHMAWRPVQSSGLLRRFTLGERIVK